MIHDNGKKEITIKDVALKAGVSTSTVGRVIGDYGSVSTETRNKVLNTIKIMDFVPNAIAQSMKSKNTKTIGVVIGNVANPFFSELVHSIETVTSKEGFSLVISNTCEDVQEEINALRMMHSKRIDGIIIATTQCSNAILDKSTKALYTGSIPTVFVDREIFGIDELCVKADHFGGSYEATSYFIKKGHKKIALIGGLQASTMEQRLEGHKKALADSSIPFFLDNMKFGKYASIEEGRFYTKELLREKKDITAIFPLNDLLCMGTLIALYEMKISIPDDISLIGWDDFPLARIMNPPISMVTQDVACIGTIATNKLLAAILSNNNEEFNLGEKRITLRTHFIERKSCKDLNNLL